MGIREAKLYPNKWDRRLSWYTFEGTTRKSNYTGRNMMYASNQNIMEGIKVFPSFFNIYFTFLRRVRTEWKRSHNKAV